jgi:hypothetical protein
MVILDPAQDTVVLNIHGICLPITLLDQWRLFDIMKNASRIPDLRCVIEIVAGTRILAFVGYAMICYSSQANACRLSTYLKPTKEEVSTLCEFEDTKWRLRVEVNAERSGY